MSKNESSSTKSLQFLNTSRTVLEPFKQGSLPEALASESFDYILSVFPILFHYTRPEANELKIEHKIKTKNTNIFGVNLLFFFCLPNIFYKIITYTMSVIIQDVAVIIFSLKI